jgi:hypothetical protein
LEASEWNVTYRPSAEIEAPRQSAPISERSPDEDRLAIDVRFVFRSYTTMS